MNNDHPHRAPPEAGLRPSVDADDLGFALPAPATLSRPRAIALGAAGLTVLLGAFAWGYLPRRHARSALVAATASSGRAVPRVDVVTPRRAAGDRAIVLPGSVRPLEETALYARANGFVRRWLVDLGARVREGQLLAEIDTPELDQELSQARAQLAQAQAGVAQAQASRDLAQTELTRYEQLVASNFVARQEYEQRRAAAAVATANVAAARAAVGVQQANVRRLVQLKGFARVVAPFAGTVTARGAERGALVSPGGEPPLFRVAATDPVRVMVQVPQDVAPGVREGTPARVSAREYPGRVFEGRVAHVAGALDAQSRTMAIEVRVPNGDAALLVGMFTEVALTLPVAHTVFELPATAVVTDARGQRVATVGPDARVHFVAVRVERDTGAVVAISQGLTGSERVVRLPSPGLREGASVEVLAP